MKILSVEQIREADAYTIAHEPIASDDLMERASAAFVEEFMRHFSRERPIYVFCGIGNNGGDGLCVARLLYHRGYRVRVGIVRFSQRSSRDFQINERRLKRLESVPMFEVNEVDDFPHIVENAVLIDALFGSGLSRAIGSFTEKIIEKINALPPSITRVAIDVPSGLYADKLTDSIVLRAHYTICFELPKLSLLFPQNYVYVGRWKAVPIGLHKEFVRQQKTNFYYVNECLIHKKGKEKSKFTHKGKNGHALLIGGSYGKIGAVVLMAKACLKIGAGLATAFVPKCAYQILQTAIPELMTLTDVQEEYISDVPQWQNSDGQAQYEAIAIGPGLGKENATAKALEKLLTHASQPLVIDADALNLIAENDYLSLIPKQSVLTPHPKEFERFVGKTANEYERLERQSALAQQYELVILVKGAHTAIALPNGDVYFNSTGNPQMATAGSGDVLTGIIAGLLAQGYNSEDSAIIGVYVHGLAGDKMAKKLGNLTAMNLINGL